MTTRRSLIYKIFQMFNLKNLTVNRISLVSKDKKPAVEQAEIGFWIFKTFENKVEKKEVVTSEQIQKLENISQKLKNDIENLNKNS